MESCSRIKDGNGRLALGEIKVQTIWKTYFEDLYNLDTQEQVASLALMGFEEATTLNERQLRELRLR